MEWFDANTTLPEKRGDGYYSRYCLILSDDGFMYVGSFFRYNTESYWKILHNGCGCCDEPPTITHWTELPPIPNDASKEK